MTLSCRQLCVYTYFSTIIYTLQYTLVIFTAIHFFEIVLVIIIITNFIANTI